MVLFDCLKPLPQVTEQSDHSENDDHLQSTGSVDCSASTASGFNSNEHGSILQSSVRLSSPSQMFPP